MSTSDVLDEWPTYQRLISATYTLIDNPALMQRAIANIGPFPENDPSAWDTWVSAYEGLAILNDAVKVTDAALAKMANFISATNLIAAAVKLPAPTQQQITDLIGQLNILSRAIQQDQRFHAALGIAKALTNNMSTTLKK